MFGKLRAVLAILTKAAVWAAVAFYKAIVKKLILIILDWIF